MRQGILSFISLMHLDAIMRADHVNLSILLTSCMFYIFAFILYLTLTHHAHFSRDDVAIRPLSTSTQSRTRRSLTYPQPHALRSQMYPLKATLPITTLTLLPTLLVYRVCRTKTFQAAQAFQFHPRAFVFMLYVAFSILFIQPSTSFSRLLVF